MKKLNRDKITRKNNPVLEILMRRDGLTKDAALDLMQQCRDALENGEYEAIQDYLGLEDDYVFDILLI